MNQEVDQYLIDGCGRCSYYKTPECKVHDWVEELIELRRIALACGLTEELKWYQPCYTYNKSNVLIISALRNCAVLAFFKGSLLQDEKAILIAPGASSQADRQFRFNKKEEILELEDLIKAYIFEAIEIEKAGLKVAFKKKQDPMPEELIQILEEDQLLKAAFEALTPGRQRGYIIHFSQPKQAKTRISRIEKWIPMILKGEGMHDAYKSKKN